MKEVLKTLFLGACLFGGMSVAVTAGTKVSKVYGENGRRIAVIKTTGCR